MAVGGFRRPSGLNRIKIIKYGTFIQVKKYDQRVIGEKPKSTIKI